MRRRKYNIRWFFFMRCPQFFQRWTASAARTRISHSLYFFRGNKSFCYWHQKFNTTHTHFLLLYYTSQFSLEIFFSPPDVSQHTNGYFNAIHPENYGVRLLKPITLKQVLFCILQYKLPHSSVSLRSINLQLCVRWRNIPPEMSQKALNFTFTTVCKHWPTVGFSSILSVYRINLPPTRD